MPIFDLTKKNAMIKIKHFFILTALVFLQACASSQSTASTETSSETTAESDSLTVKKSKTGEEAGIKMNGEVRTESIVTPKKKKKK
jgi:ABC-type enterochelin transport system substrate-binding protein